MGYYSLLLNGVICIFTLSIPFMGYYSRKPYPKCVLDLLLSIPFMGYSRAEKVVDKEKLSFQFPLWDTLWILLILPTSIFVLSIPFMGYFGSSIPTSNITKLQTFNSLYGILKLGKM